MEQIGLEALMKTDEWSKGFSKYMSDMQNAIKTTDRSASQISSAWSKVSSDFEKMMSGASKTGSGLEGMAGAAGSTSGSFGALSAAMFAANAAFGVVSAAGSAAVNVFKNVASSIGEVVSSGVQTVGEFQRLGIALESLAAREIKQSGAATDLNDALAQAGPVAKGAFNELRSLSLISPFEYDDIVNTFRLNMALGQTMDTSMDLTGAIMDMVAAGGLTGDYAERIAYNFSQMSLTGKITQRDVRDLAQAGVDLSDVLSSTLGMSIDEINDKLESGQMTFEEVSQAFVQYADENFAGAAERMSRTLTGLYSSFNDLWTFASIDLFSPAMEAIAEPLGKLLDYAREIVESGTLQKVGFFLGYVAENAMKAAESALTAGSSFLSGFGDSMLQAASNAFSWGMNISVELAGGIIEGAATAISQAMDFIASMLDFFLSPGSPPKVAPTIDDWGASAMNEFLQGFTETDFGILEDMQSPIKKALSTLVNIGELDSEQSGQLFYQLSTQLSEVIATGEGAETLFDSIAASTGQFGEEMAELARIQYEVASSTKAIEEANQVIEDQQEKETKANEAVMKQIQEYNNLLASGASAEQLSAKMAELETAKDIASQAKADRVAAEEKLKAVEATQSALKAQQNIQQDIVSQMLDMVDATKVSFDISTDSDLSGLLDTGSLSSGLSSAVTGLSNKVKGSGLGSDIGKSIGGNIEKSLYEEFKDMELGTDVTGIFNESEMQVKLETMFDPLKSVWEEKVIPSVDEIIGSFDRLSSALEPINDFLSGLGEKFETLIPEGFVDTFGNIVGHFLGLSTISLAVVGGIAAIGLAMITLQALLMNPITWLAILKTAWENDWLFIRTSTETTMNGLSTIWNDILLPALTKVSNWIETHVQPVFDALGHVVDAVIGKGSEALALIWENRLQPALKMVNDFISATLTPILDTLVGSVSDAKTESTFFQGVLDELKKGLKGVEEFLGKVAKGIDDFALGIENIKLPSFLVANSPTPLEVGLVGINDIMGTLSASGIPGLISSFQALSSANEVFTNINASLNNFQTCILSLPNTMRTVSESFSSFLLSMTSLNEQFMLFISQVSLLNESFILLMDTMISLQEIYSLFSERLSVLFTEIFVGMTEQIVSGFIPALILLQQQLDLFSQKVLNPLYDFFFMQFIPIIEVIYTYVSKLFPESLLALAQYLKTEFANALNSTMQQYKDWAGSAVNASVAVDRLSASVWGLVAALKALEEVGVPDAFKENSPSDFSLAMIHAAENTALSDAALLNLKNQLTDSVFSSSPQIFEHYSYDPQVIVVQAEAPVVNMESRSPTFNNYGGGDIESAFLNLLAKEEMLHG